MEKWQSQQKHKTVELFLPNPGDPDFKSFNSSFNSERESVAAATGHRTKLSIHRKW